MSGLKNPATLWARARYMSRSPASRDQWVQVPSQSNALEAMNPTIAITDNPSPISNAMSDSR